MNTESIKSFRQTNSTPADQFGNKVALRLNDAANDLPYDISERLRAARVRALSQRKVELAQVTEVVGYSGGSAILQGPRFGMGLMGRFASLLPLLALVAGVIFIDFAQDDVRAREIAEVDSELLTDDLPPAAYLDPGFAQFLRINLPGKGQER